MVIKHRVTVAICNGLVRYWPAQITLGDGNNPISKCFKAMPDFTQGPEYFANQVTEYYKTYPGDRILLIQEVLETLVRGKSIQDLHEHPPFPTKGSTPKHSGQ